MTVHGHKVANSQTQHQINSWRKLGSCAPRQACKREILLLIHNSRESIILSGGEGNENAHGFLPRFSNGC